MNGYQRYVCAGNLTRDPDLRFTPKGTAVVKISVAVNENYTTADGEKKESVCFLEIEAWGKTAETIGQYFKKGHPILFEGKLKLDTWEDKNTKQKVSKLKVVLEKFNFIGGKNDGQSGGSSDHSIQRPAALSSPAPTEPDMPPSEPDDVPF